MAGLTDYFSLKSASKLKIRIFYLLALTTTVYIILYFHSQDINSNIQCQQGRNNNNKCQPTIQDKQTVLLFIGIVSAPRLIFRRNALRRSWITRCKKHNIPCWIFTDGQDMHGKRLPGHIFVPLQQEQYLHGDLVLAESPGGINFARRYLWMIDWASKRYRFEFFLRVDDDYFICLDRLLLELPYRGNMSKLYWGHVHCHPPGGIRVDEGFVIVTNDLVEEFLKEQNETLMCHPYGDQAMAIWINNIPGVTYFGDPRVHHKRSVDDPSLKNHSDICGSYLAIHGSYPLQIERFWTRDSEISRGTNDYEVPRITYPCGDQDKKYNTTNFLGIYHAQPILCKKMPAWNISGFYPGRGGK